MSPGPAPKRPERRQRHGEGGPKLVGGNPGRDDAVLSMRAKFGKHEGRPWREIVDEDPGYVTGYVLTNRCQKDSVTPEIRAALGRALREETVTVEDGGRAGADVVDIRTKRIPSPPEGLLERTEERWREFWLSPLANVVERGTDSGAIRRLFCLYDEWERSFHAYRSERMVEGSQGQPVLNPAGKMMDKFQKEIRQLEDRIGLTPRARLQLGITWDAARRTLDDLNRELEAERDAGHGDEDPRV